jgi:hypothetical protein
VLIKETSTFFLAIILLIGTITLIYPSFIIGAQAESYYGGMDKDRKSFNISSLKCNNINVNVNGLEFEVLPPSLSILLTNGEADANAYSYGSGKGNYASASSSSSEINDFRFICINNNNNTVIGGEEPIPPIPPVPPVDECIFCFEETTQAVRDAINTFLAAQGVILVAPGIEIPADVNTFEQLCKWLTENAPLELTRTQIINLISQFLRANPTVDRGEVQELVECLIDADLIKLTTCDDCFARLDANIQTAINTLLARPGPLPLPAGIGVQIPDTVTNIAQLCLFLNADPIQITNSEIPILVTAFVQLIGSGPGSQTIAQALVDCLIEIEVIIIATPELTSSNINADTSAFDINTSGGLASSFSTPPTIAQETGDLTATEKITKLKTQWLELLP